MERDFSLPNNKLGQPPVSHIISLKLCVTATLTVESLLQWLLSSLCEDKKSPKEDKSQFELMSVDWTTSF